MRRPESTSRPNTAASLEQKNKMPRLITHNKRDSCSRNKLKEKNKEVEGINCSTNIDDQMRIEEHAERLATSARKVTNKRSRKINDRLEVISKPYLKSNNKKKQVLKSSMLLQQSKVPNNYEKIDSSVDNFLDIIYLETRVSSEGSSIAKKSPSLYTSLFNFYPSI